jgi:hypothetical protein
MRFRTRPGASTSIPAEAGPHGPGFAIALTLVAALALSAGAAAQQPPGAVRLGGLDVPPCPLASDPEYGRVQEKPIEIGGGAGYVAAREARYLAALRGPQGQPLKTARRGSGPGPKRAASSNPAILDHWIVSYEGEDQKPVTLTLFLDAYHFSLPRVPAGFTCGAPLAAALGVPPIDIVTSPPQVAALAIEQGSKTDAVPVPLDPAAPRGYLFDRFTMIALRARAAAAAGQALDPERPPKDLEPQGLAVLAYPMACGNKTIPPQNVELIAPQGSIPRNGEPLPEAAMAAAFPGIPVPAGSFAVRFRQASPSEVRIVYAEACEGAPTASSVPMRFEPARLVSSSVVPLPPDVVTDDPTVYLQAVIDQNGRFMRPLYIGGLEALVPAALAAVTDWRAEPLRVNGAPVVNPIVLQVLFGAK